MFFHVYYISSSCRAASTDIPEPLSPLFPIIHRLRQVFRLHPVSSHSCCYVSSCWSSYFCTSICGGPQEYIAYELVLASPAVSRVSGSSNLYSFRDGGKCPYSWCLVGCCRQDLFNTALNILVQFPSSFLSSRLVSVHVVHPYSSIDTTAAWKILRFILSVRSDFHMIESLSIPVHAFVSRVSMSFSVDETLLPVCVCVCVCVCVLGTERQREIFEIREKEAVDFNDAIL